MPLRDGTDLITEVYITGENPTTDGATSISQVRLTQETLSPVALFPDQVGGVTITFRNFPGTTEDLIFEGIPGNQITNEGGSPVTAQASWTVSANNGSAFNGAQSVTGLDTTNFSFISGSQGSISNTETTIRIRFNQSIFPNNSLTVDYSDLTFTLPQSTIVTYSYTFTGGLGRSTSCTTFSGSTCGVSSASVASDALRQYSVNASGTGGRGAGSCSQSCAVSISASGGSSSCSESNTTTAQDVTINVQCNLQHPQSATIFESRYCVSSSSNPNNGSGLCNVRGSLTRTDPDGDADSFGNIRGTCGAPTGSYFSPGTGYDLFVQSVNGSEAGTHTLSVINNQNIPLTTASCNSN